MVFRSRYGLKAGWEVGVRMARGKEGRGGGHGESFAVAIVLADVERESLV